MSVFVERAKEKIRNSKRKIKILFAEGWNKEIQTAAKFLLVEDYITPYIILRDKNDYDDSLKNINCIIISEIDVDYYGEKLFALRKGKINTLAQAKELVKQANYLAALLLKLDEVDGAICGIEYTTKDTLKAALQIIKPAKDTKLVTTGMCLEKNDHLMIFGDCSLVLNPNAQELAEITKSLVLFAKDTVSCHNLNAAMLSYSTEGSGSGESVDKVRQAYNIVKSDEAFSFANVYGEIQFDAAYIESVRNKKCKHCTWSENPNIFVFPNLDAGNIGYKILERCAGYLAIGPILIGLDKPMNDLSRGTNAESVISISYITAAQALMNIK